ncbi:uncharacterized protein LOC126849614 [Cataglyphis hispanica]|uniref:uncharacterized protein LOC126849614 n=1 Tax=Cataglyphis hispanica TaxID=1086592 RepID=UPI00217F3D32|nr:uncharacterized protein LOC126849614 [Cataglyphis hispanica]XP_050447564.1 uncharacterized protein LOC126849614 [Cataglyphis hispanica]
MSSGRRATRPVRQLSLQQPAPRRQHIRRQKSAEDDCNKSLQIYANPIARDRVVTNATDKPKVRVAWGDDRHDCDGLAQVEVVARQIPSRSRPTTGRSGRTYATTEKASILYSRQELAERLRLAWKHREQNKANIDIFLAHNVAVEERCESELSMSTPPTPFSGEESDLMKDERKSSQNLKISGNLEDREKKSEIDNRSERECERKLEVASAMMENDLLMKKDENVTKGMEKEREENEKTTNTQTNSDIEEKKKKTKINIDCTSLHLSTNQLHSSMTFPSLKPENADPAKNNDNFSARQKRASFQSGTNRAFLISEKTSKEITEVKDKIASAKSIEIRCASAATRSPIDKGTILARSSSTTSLEKTRRTSSAPPQRRNLGPAPGTRVQVNIVIDAPGLTEATDKSIVCGKMQSEKDAVEKIEENSTKILRGERSIRSAPLKKRSKSAKRRLLASSGGCKDEERGGRRKSSVDPRTSDVITMVSLVSSADSDSDAENSPGDDKLINELRSKLPTMPIIKTSINSNHTVPRKPIKSVSFQRDSFDEEPTKDEKRIANNVQPPYFGFTLNVIHGNGYKDSSDKQDQAVDNVVTPSTPTLVAVPVLSISQDTEKAVPETPLTDREKRCLAVPIGELHDKKRKLLRMRSIPNRPIITEQTNNVPMEMKEQRPCLAMSRIDLVAVPVPPIDIPLSKVEHFSKETLPAKETPREMMPSEPHFQTIKEKECWHLYRRMCDKGVYVSFDTVLRGMLTPTEYRLRQKEYSQDLQ